MLGQLEYSLKTIHVKMKTGQSFGTVMTRLLVADFWQIEEELHHWFVKQTLFNDLP